MTKASLKRFGLTQGCPACGGDPERPRSQYRRARLKKRSTEDNSGQTNLVEEEAREALRMAQGLKARDEDNIFEDENK